MKTVKWHIKALRQLRKIKDKSMRVKISEESKTLKDFPNCKNIKKLTNHKYDYRLRVGSYRVFFTPELEIVYIDEVKKRNERTY